MPPTLLTSRSRIATAITSTSPLARAGAAHRGRRTVGSRRSRTPRVGVTRRSRELTRGLVMFARIVRCRESLRMAGLAAVVAFGTRCGGSRQADGGVDASSEAGLDAPTEGGVDGPTEGGVDAAADAGDESPGGSGDCNPPCGYVNFATLTCFRGQCAELAADPDTL